MYNIAAAVRLIGSLCVYCGWRVGGRERLVGGQGWPGAAGGGRRRPGVARGGGGRLGGPEGRPGPKLTFRLRKT